MRYTIDLFLCLILIMADVIISAIGRFTGTVAQVIIQAVIQVVMTALFIDIYNGTVLISIPPSISTSPSGLSVKFFSGICVIRLSVLLIVRILYHELITNQIGVIFDAINLAFHIVFLLNAFELGKVKYYNIKYTHVIT